MSPGHAVIVSERQHTLETRLAKHVGDAFSWSILEYFVPYYLDILQLLNCILNVVYDIVSYDILIIWIFGLPSTTICNFARKVFCQRHFFNFEVFFFLRNLRSSSKILFSGYFQATTSQFTRFLVVTLDFWNCWGLLSTAKKNNEVFH